MAISAAIAFWATSILFVITPGADWAYAISAGLRGRVIPAVVGLLVGHTVATIIVAAGVGAVLAEAPGVLMIMTIAGASYLVWLGIASLRRPAVPSADDEELGSASRWLFKGAGVSGLNPKVFLLFLALLPQFASADFEWPLGLQILALGLIHVTMCAIVYLVVGFGARAVLGARPRTARVVSRISGTAMVIIGLALLIEQFSHAVPA